MTSTPTLAEHESQSELRAQLRALEAELQFERDIASRLRSSLEEFGGVLAHDLRGPTRHVNVFADLIRASEDPPPQSIGGHIDHIQTAAGRMFDMIELMAGYVRTLGKTPTRERVDLNACVNEVIASRQTQIAACGAQIDTDSLPSITGDYSFMVSAFQGVIDNALLLGLEVRPDIKIRVEQNEAWVTVVMEDNIGDLVQGSTERIFSVLASLENRSGGTTRPGLAVSQALIEAQGGAVAVDTPNEGLRVCLKLPAVQASHT
jgi:light-regulated signal transduction histidine kinase (bacteriophytochrome)